MYYYPVKNIESLTDQLTEINQKVESLHLRIAHLQSIIDDHEKTIRTLVLDVKKENGKKYQIIRENGKSTTSAARYSENKAVEEFYDRALTAYYYKDYDKAITLFKSFSITYPDHPLSGKAQKWVDYLKRLSRPEKTAAEDLRESYTVKRYTRDDLAEALYNRAISAYQDKKTDHAVTLFSRFIQDYPDHSLSPKAHQWIHYLTSEESRLPVGSNEDDAALDQQREIEVIYRNALSAYQKNNYDEAVTLFQKFWQEYPSHYLADNALYWIGECYYSQNKYYDAVLTFKEVIKRYPKGNKIQDALLKTGYAYLALDDPDNATVYFSEIIRRYPYTPAAANARKELERIRTKRPPSPPESQDELQINKIGYDIL